MLVPTTVLVPCEIHIVNNICCHKWYSLGRGNLNIKLPKSRVGENPFLMQQKDGEADPAACPSLLHNSTPAGSTCFDNHDGDNSTDCNNMMKVGRRKGHSHRCILLPDRGGVQLRGCTRYCEVVVRGHGKEPPE